MTNSGEVIMEQDGRKRIVIENIQPSVDNGIFPIKRVVGEKVHVEADVSTDGHDDLIFVLMVKQGVEGNWVETAMAPLGVDRWKGVFTVETAGTI